MKKLLLLMSAVICAFAVSCTKPAQLMVTSSTSFEATEDGGTFEVTFTTNKGWNATCSESWVKAIPASGDASDATQTVKIEVAPATTTSPRTATVTLTAEDKVATISIKQEGKTAYKDITAYSNCYVINQGGNYCFDATVIGNGKAGILDGFHTSSEKISPVGAKLVWEEAENLVTRVKLEAGKLCFTLKDGDGNAVVAATGSNGEILWSWHIWSIEKVGIVKVDDYEVMDRNLGAMGNSAADGEAAFGMYYQWGRKDPFSRVVGFTDTTYPCEGPDPAINTIAYSVSHPDSYLASIMPNEGGKGNWIVSPKLSDNHLWGAAHNEEGWLTSMPKKTIYDPCPSGYMLMAPQVTWNYVGTTVEGGIDVAGLFIPNSSFIYTVGHGWWDAYAVLWTSSSAAWGDTENEAFRIVPGDCHMNYARGFAHPVRCMKVKE